MKKQDNINQYNFKLPQDLIAQQPAKPADSCQLLVIDKKTNSIIDEKFLNLTDYLKPDDVLVFNNSKVIPARLIGTKKTGGKVEILLLKQLNQQTWQCLVGKLAVNKQINTVLAFSKYLTGQIITREQETAQIKFNLKGQKLLAEIFRIGQMPTPPYIKRLAKKTEYQNIFADPKKSGSVAAPTAGLHFTKRIFKKLQAKNIKIEYITLHVGLGTFAPIKEKDYTKHKIHSEYYELDKATVQRLNKAKKQGHRIIAVGTTSVRVLETCATKNKNHKLKANKANTSIYIYPPYEFKFVDAMITNFHLPKSSLILLVSSFANQKLIKKAYQHAIKKKYRFYSFGDVMFIK